MFSNIEHIELQSRLEKLLQPNTHGEFADLLLQLERKLEKLPLNADHFQDNGNRMVSRFISFYQSLINDEANFLNTYSNFELNPTELQMLNQIASLESGKVPEPEALNVLISLKTRLQQAIENTGQDPILENSLNLEFWAALNQFIDAMETGLGTTGRLQKTGQTSDQGLLEILYRFCYHLKNNTEVTRTLLKLHNPGVATTIGKVLGKEVSSTYLDNPQDNLFFDTVIIDEAARAMPLDLLMPMSVANRRIILIGDHRQLPHMIDEQVIANMSEADQTELKEQILFLKLQKTLREREKMDGKQRVIMLTEQYRMHPTLGDFVSRSFYEHMGDEQIKTELPAQNFEHEIDLFKNKVAAWVHIDYARGKENGGRGQSYFRKAEAKAVINTLQQILKIPQEYSIGVISFYAAQVSLIQEYKDAEPTIRDYKHLEIGTVDSFQGKEFDIVILSMVRCNQHKSLPLTHKYGFLASPNRLNVAMSRQKRLLIMVGDLNMIPDTPPEDTELLSIFGLVQFKQLCGGDHGKIIRTEALV